MSDCKRRSTESPPSRRFLIAEVQDVASNLSCRAEPGCGLPPGDSLREELASENARLKDELARLRAGTSAYFWSADVSPDGGLCYRYWSPSVEAMTGRNPDFYMPGVERWLSTVHPDDVALTREKLTTLARGRLEHATLEYRIVRTDGTVRWLRNCVSGSRTSSGVGRLDGVVTDISDQKRAEELLRTSEERYRASFERAGVGIAHLTVNGRYIWVNEKFCEILGYSRDEILGRTFQHITHPDDLVSNLDNHRRLVAGQCATFSMEKRYLNKNGECVWVDVAVSMIRGQRGHPDILVSVVRDISLRKRMEALLARKHALLEAIIESTTDGILVVDEQGTILHCNRLFGEMWDVPPELIERRSATLLTEYIKDHVTDPDSFVARINFLLHSSEGHFDILEFSDDRVFERFSRRLVGSAEPHCRIFSYRDVTGQKHAERALREAKEKAERAIAELRSAEMQLLHAEKLASLGEIGAGIAHELNQPLTVLQISLELLQEDPDRLISERLPHLRRMTTCVERMARIVDNVRGFARQADFAPALIMAAKPVEDALGLVSQQFRLHDVEVVTSFGDRPIEVRADRFMLQQVFLNLFANALHALDALEPGRQRRLDVALWQARDHVVYAVSDTGAGVPEEDRAKIFDPFFTTKGVGEGTGLGLSLSYGIVRQHGGTISYKPAAEGGACFVIELPIAGP
ncbi:MAG: PAS domain S-box protein [Candidatus Schekmanbacteria bacterium]|nr:PAS domain S-box protein [Candidatus Schekmanbacteria bacterium]